MKLPLTQVIAVILGAMVLLLWASVASADLAAGRAAYIKGDYALAFQVYKPLAEEGDAEAQYMLGSLYKSGQGVPHDPREAMKWYKRASDQGHRHAQTAMQNYAYMYPDLYIKINEIKEIKDIKEINEIIESRARRQARGNSAIAVMTDSGEIVEVDVAGFNDHVPRSKERTGYSEKSIEYLHQGATWENVDPYAAYGYYEEETLPETPEPRQRQSRILVGVPGGAIDTGSGKIYPGVGGVVVNPATGRVFHMGTNY